MASIINQAATFPSDANAASLALIGTAPGSFNDEWELHQKLKPWVVEGCREWFKDCDDVRSIIDPIFTAGIPVIEPETVKISVFLSHDEHASAREWARKDKRSLSSWVGVLIEEKMKETSRSRR